MPPMPPAPAPRFPATSPAQYRAGSGVGVSVLLRQADGFDGFARRSVYSSMRRTSPSRTVNTSKKRRRPSARRCSCPAPTSANSDVDVLAAETRRVRQGWLCSSGPLQEIIPGRRTLKVAPMGSAQENRLPFDLRDGRTRRLHSIPARRSSASICSRNRPWAPPVRIEGPLDRLHETAHDRHVLLRHRPRSIPQAQESA